MKHFSSVYITSHFSLIELSIDPICFINIAVLPQLLTCHEIQISTTYSRSLGKISELDRIKKCSKRKYEHETWSSFPFRS